MKTRPARLTGRSLAVALALATTTLLSRSALAAPADSAATPAAFDSAAALAKARAMNAALRMNDGAKLWGEMNEAMRTALGDFEKFTDVMAQIRAGTGANQDCPAEVIERQAGYWIYRGTCRFEKAPAPLVIQYAFDEHGRIGGFFVKPEAKEHATKFLDYKPKTALHLPFHGEWEVVWGGPTIQQNYHAVARDQRFALDLLVVRDSSDHRGTGRVPQEYFAFGLPIVAPAAGKVVWVTDGLPDNRLGQMNPAQAIGNGVVLDHGNGEFSVFAHFERGSVRVKLGQEVAEGDTLGRCGNSGNSSQPHLHYHLQNGPVPFDADGLPAVFVDYVADGKPVERGAPVKGQRIRRK